MNTSGMNAPAIVISIVLSVAALAVATLLHGWGLLLGLAGARSGARRVGNHGLPVRDSARGTTILIPSAMVDCMNPGGIMGLVSAAPGAPAPALKPTL
jgi:hypothetical protein